MNANPLARPDDDDDDDGQVISAERHGVVVCMLDPYAPPADATEMETLPTK